MAILPANFFLNNSSLQCAFWSWPASFTSQTVLLLFLRNFRKRLLTVSVSLMDLSEAISPLMISSTVTIHPTQGLFIAPPWKAAELFLAFKISQRYDTSAGTHFYPTSFLVLTRNDLSSNSRRGPTINFIPSWSTLNSRSFFLHLLEPVRRCPIAHSSMM